MIGAVAYVFPLFGLQVAAHPGPPGSPEDGRQRNKKMDSLAAGELNASHQPWVSGKPDRNFSLICSALFVFWYMNCCNSHVFDFEAIC